MISSAELSQFFDKGKTPREMKDQIMALLGEWKEEQPPELGKGAKKKEYLIQECLAGRMREAVRRAVAGITQSMSRVGKCIDNGPMEG